MATDSEKIVLEYKVEVDGLKVGLKSVQSEMKETEAVGVASADKVGTKYTELKKKIEDLQKAEKELEKQRANAAPGKVQEQFAKSLAETRLELEKTNKQFKDLNTQEKVLETNTKSLRTQLKELKAELAEATDPADIERLAKAAGEVSNKLNDATQAAQIFASDSSFEQVGTALRGIAGNLLSLNFKQAADQSKLLVAASKQITFKEALTGIKDLGTTLLNVGKSLLSNPIFLLGTAITLIITNFDKLKSAGGAIGAFFTGISDFITTLTSGIESFGNSIGLINTSVSQLAEDNARLFQDTANFIEEINSSIQKNVISILQAQGQITDAQAQELAARDAASERFAEIEKERKAELFKIDVEFVKNRSLEEELRFKKNAALLEQEILVNKEFDKRIAAEANNLEVQLESIQTAAIKRKQEEQKKSQEAEIQALIKHNQELKSLIDKFNADAGGVSRELELARATEEEKLLITKSGTAERLKAEKQLIDEAFSTESERDKTVRLQAKAVLDAALLQLEQKFQLDVQALRDKNGKGAVAEVQEVADELGELSEDELQAIEDTTAEEIAAIDSVTEHIQFSEDQRAEIQRQAIQTTQSLLNSFSELQRRKADEAIELAEEVADSQIESLDKELKNKEITQAQYDEKKKRIADELAARISAERIKEFNTQKSIALTQAGINTAVAVTKAYEQGGAFGIVLAALVAAAGAAEIAIIASQQPPKFAKGVVGLKGKGTETSDEIPALLSRNESVITAEGTKRHKGLLEAINKGKGELFIHEVYLAPILKQTAKLIQEQKQNDFAKNIANSFMLKQTLNDGNILESLKMTRKQAKENALFIAKTLSQNKNRYW